MNLNLSTPPLDAGMLTATFLLYQTSNDEIDKLTHYKLTHPSYSHLDWSAAERWYTMLQPNTFENYFLMCREACRIFLNENQLLSDLACYGREMLLSNLTEDEIQVFKSAFLLERIPDEEVICWWDEFKIKARMDLNDKLLSQGRLAERWTIEEELKNLKSSSICAKPEWVSIDSDRLGYDISSFKLVNGVVVPILIEVKSYAKENQPHFYITANEWKRALETINNEYIFYIWCIETKTYKIFKPIDLLSHIPANKGQGQWQSAFIELDKLQNKS